MCVGVRPLRYPCSMRGVLASLRVAVAGLVVLAGAGLARHPEAGLAASDRPSSILLLGTGANGVYRSLDGGHTWRPASDGLPPGGVWQVEADPTLPSTAYATTGSLYRTDDAGQTWRRVPGVSQGGPGLTALAVQSSLVLAAGPTAIVEGGGQRHWAREQVAVPGGAPLQLLPVSPDLLYAVGRDGRLYVYGNIPWLHSTGWQLLGSGALPGPITALAAVPLSISAKAKTLCLDDGQQAPPEDCVLLYAAVAGYGVYQSTDSGRTWAHPVQDQGALPEGCTVRALMAGGDIGTAYAGIEGRGLYRSRRSNQFWRPAAGTPAVTITALLQVGSTIVAATAGQGVQLYDAGNDRLRYLGRAAGVADGVLGLSLTQFVPPPPPPQPAAPTLPGRCERTGVLAHYLLCGPFLTFYQRVGQTMRLRIFGTVISPLMYDRIEPGLIVQYFERVRFEYRPGGRVSLTPLGQYFARNTHFSSPVTPMQPARRFPTGYSAGGPFLKFWRQHDGPTLLGPPVSPVFETTNSDGSGRRYIMQYFQYARLEYHTELSGTGYTIELGALGQDYLHCMQTRTYCRS